MINFGASFSMKFLKSLFYGLTKIDGWSVKTYCSPTVRYQSGNTFQGTCEMDKWFAYAIDSSHANDVDNKQTFTAMFQLST